MFKKLSTLLITIFSTTFLLSPSYAKKGELEKIYAPILYLDSEEKIPLTSVEKLFEEPISLLAKNPLGKSFIIRKNIKLSELGKFTKKKLKVQEQELPLYLEFNNTKSEFVPIAYYHTIIKDNYIYLQYWFFYTYNDTTSINPNPIIHLCGNHQGDWEHISLKVNAENYNKAITEDDYLKALEEVYFSQHNVGDNDFRKFKKNGDKDLYFQGTHIKAYVAKGSHATYSEPDNGKGLLLYDVGGIKLYDSADGKGLIVETKDHLVNIDEQSWNKFGGRWGRISDDICSIAEAVSKISNDGPISTMYRSYYFNTDWEKANK